MKRLVVNKPFHKAYHSYLWILRYGFLYERGWIM